ncbi:MAG: hypothetical protein V1870_01515 [Candidatus Aenigmatarchaeota archaeon]
MGMLTLERGKVNMKEKSGACASGYLDVATCIACPYCSNRREIVDALVENFLRTGYAPAKELTLENVYGAISCVYNGTESGLRELVANEQIETYVNGTCGGDREFRLKTFAQLPQEQTEPVAKQVPRRLCVEYL